MLKKDEKTPCECASEVMPYLIFDNRTEKPYVKRRVKAHWKYINEIKDAILNPTEDKQIKTEAPVPVEEPAEEDGVRLLFDKMLALRMDQHALAITDGYRTRPQVCICDNECCDCFDHSNFLHKLKLHDHKELLRSVYAKMENEGKKSEVIPEAEPTEPTGDGEEASSRGEANDEFAFKNEEDYEGDDPNEVGLDLAVIERVKKVICSEQTVCPEKKVSAPVRKTIRGVRSIKIDDPPYETKFNSTHKPVSEFDPNLYKNLVREEVKKFNLMSVSERRSRAVDRVKNLSQRPPWKI